MRSVTAIVPALAVLLTPCSLHAQTHEHAVSETRAEVPALSEMHEVIYPLWHEAWPGKDMKMMSELLPEVQRHVAAVEGAELPGILRDKRTVWGEQVKALRATLAAYEEGVSANDIQATLDAVEALHSRFEQMVRIIRPVMKELDAYHQLLYTVYHKITPEKRFSELPGAAAEMTGACSALVAAAVPKRFAAREANLREAFAALCSATMELQTAAAGSDSEAMAAAVERVHTAYQGAEAAFE